ncbi:hypothetical protein MMH89_03220 [Candidatus Comchoanobacter bicostacola]|uniref:Uncharacterized protein n=1 Tax=Candidatus Comchoanobacter bicostacola TaxID=2919598 RepID=A0ABY5DJP8_9GAMM|nr:hypothetical protein [Candidatus Comchoanobacter bicostacola]UTC24233.1 hypothetical protein MMH89_03220 [Candidatus Comchoanobacter bicostacola]
MIKELRVYILEVLEAYEKVCDKKIHSTRTGQLSALRRYCNPDSPKDPSSIRTYVHLLISEINSEINTRFQIFRKKKSSKLVDALEEALVAYDRQKTDGFSFEAPQSISSMPMSMLPNPVMNLMPRSPLMINNQ